MSDEATIQELQAEIAALKQQKALLESVIDNSPSIIYVKDSEGRYLLVNRQTAKILGRPAEDILGKTDSDILPPDVAEHFRAGDQQVLATKQAYDNEECLPIEGEPHHFLAQGFPILDEAGVAYAVAGIATDITERKHIEEELRLFRTLFDHSPDGIALGEVGDGKSNTGLLYANHSYSAMLGYESAVGLSSETLINYNETDMPALASSIRQTGSWGGEVAYYHKDGSTVYAHATVFSIRNAEGVPTKMATISRDLTELRKSEEERAILQQQVIEAQRTALRELS